MNVLILENEHFEADAIARAVRECYDDEGWAEDGKPLIDRRTRLDDRRTLSEGQYDFAIVDYELAGGDNGFAAIDFLREHSLYRLPRIIVYTGKAKGADKELEAFRKGIMTYVRKPNDYALRTAIKNVLNDIQKERILRSVPTFGNVSLRRFMVDNAGWNALSKGIKQEVCFLFTDLSNSSRFIQSWLSAGSAPPVAEFLRSFFAMATTAIRDNGGTIDKYIGDEVMAYFVSPDGKEQNQLCTRAVNAACTIHSQFAEWLVDAERRFGKATWPVKHGLGVKTAIHFGEVIWAALGTHEFYSVSILTTEVIKAARMMQHCLSPKERKALGGARKKLIEAGEIWITEPVLRHLSALAHSPVQDVILKDFSGSNIRVCRILPKDGSLLDCSVNDTAAPE